MAVQTEPRSKLKDRKNAPRKKHKKRGFFRRFWWVFLLVPFVGFLAVAGAVIYLYVHLQIPDAPPVQQTTYLTDSAGQPLAQIHSAVNRTVIPLSSMPKILREAVISAEDKTFYTNPGIDPLGILRAAWADLTHGQVVQGGSTITQQYVKNVYTGSQQTLSRKVKEALLAIKLEQQYTKDQILEKYLNTIYFGHGAYGVQAAAETYWNEPASRLTLLQSATLAGAIAAPSAYDTIDHPKAAVKRRNYVLGQMAADGYLSAARAAKLEQRGPVKTHPTQPHYPSDSAYFVSYTTQQLINRYGANKVYEGGLNVTTTLDRTLQAEAVSAVQSILNTPGDPQAALVAIDPRTGAIRAMYGGKNFQKSQVNLATGCKGCPGRQAGSAFKIFTLAAAMNQGISLSSVWNGPAQITINDPRCAGASGPWQVANAEPYSGTFSLLQATADSVNTVFAQLVTKVGPDAVVKVAHRMGISSPLQPQCSITLGAQGVNPLEMTRAYATVADRGIRHDATPIQTVENPHGKIVDRIATQGVRAIPANNADLVTYALQGVIQNGTGTAASLYPRPAAGKTGTAQSYVDAWFCGYVPQLATCVWVGYPNKETPMNSVEGYAPVYGGTIPATIWHSFMTRATAHMPVRAFVRPSFAGYNGGPTAPVPSPTPATEPSTRPSHSPRPRPTHTPPPTPTPTPTPSTSPSKSPKPHGQSGG